MTSNQLELYKPDDALVPFKQSFLVPTDWKSCGVVVYVAGGGGVQSGQPIALVINPTSISLCDGDGPVQSVPLGSIRDVSVADLTGFSLPVNTPSGVMEMATPRAKGVKIKYELNAMGTQLELTLFTLSPKAAFDWVSLITSAIHDRFSGIGHDNLIISR